MTITTVIKTVAPAPGDCKVPNESAIAPQNSMSPKMKMKPAQNVRHRGGNCRYSVRLPGLPRVIREAGDERFSPWRFTLSSLPSPMRPERAFERDPDQLAACSDPRLLKQLLQCRLDCAIRNAELGANFLIGEALEYASEHLLLAFRQEGANSLLLPLVNPIGHELNYFRIDPNLSAHNQPDRFGKRARRIVFEEDARSTEVQRGRRFLCRHSGRDHHDLS